jgi:glutathione S-transferase
MIAKSTQYDTNDEIVFHHNPQSPRGRLVRFMLEEVSAPYRVELVRFDNTEHKAPSFLAINPMGKLPAIEHRGTVITESAAICAYLADAFPQTGLAPASVDRARGPYLRWLFFAAGCVEPAVVDRLLSRPSADRRALGYGTYEDTLNALEKALGAGPYVLGDRFSAADVYIASQIVWGLRKKSLEPRPVFEDYLGRIASRSAFKRAAEKDDALANELGFSS